MSEKHSHHHHSHSHAHHHAHGAVMGRMRLALILNFVFACIELVGGVLTNSVAIMSDALHDFGDALAVAVAMSLEKASQRKSDGLFSYGYRRFSTLGALITGLILLIGSVFILMESVPRLLSPEQPHTEGMIFLALLGLAVNGYAAYRISHGESLNEKMLMWHMLEDVMGWAMVLVGAITMKFYHVPQLDAVMAIALALWIMYNVFQNLRQALQVFLMAAPETVDLARLEATILKLPLVEGLHHGHLWSLDGESHIYTGHVVLIPSASLQDMEAVKQEVKKLVREFGVVEATIETEISGSSCFDPEHP